MHGLSRNTAKVMACFDMLCLFFFAFNHSVASERYLLPAAWSGKRHGCRRQVSQNYFGTTLFVTKHCLFTGSGDLVDAAGGSYVQLCAAICSLTGEMCRVGVVNEIDVLGMIMAGT